MENIIDLLGILNGIAWGPYMLALIAGTGLYLMLGLKLFPIIKLPFGFRQLSKKSSSKDKGDIEPRSALATALSATVGTGNIAGVASAIAIGGPGAIFWMWIMGIVGMATKYAEAVLAVKYREKDKLGNYVGGPMYYIRNGLGENWKWLAFIFAFFGMIAAFGIGNMIQSNSVAAQIQNVAGIDPLVSGLIIALIASLVIIGGIKRISKVATKLVPFMALIYIVAALYIIFSNIGEIPSAISLIVHSAFNGTEGVEAFGGATVWAAIQYGVARGVFSNEAGLGSAPIAHAAAKTNSPVAQGTIGMLGTFIDTIVLCTMTALVIVISGAWVDGSTSSVLSSNAFAIGLPSFGELIITLSLILFAFTTILGWSYYGERCSSYIFGEQAIKIYRVLWIIFIVLGAYTLNLTEDIMSNINILWLVADTMNALMAVPNLIALLLLSPIVFKVTRDYFKK
ncbi:MAG: sodium:alanine symporter family protein [Gammaproteobacteria bacterium]|nr:sodium:alanine symporter family protein [Gammaproteobacteria bacterium]